MRIWETSPVAQWLRLHLPVQQCGFNPWSRNQDPACRVVQPKTKKIQCMSEHFAPWINSGVASLALRIQYKVVFNLEWSCLWCFFSLSSCHTPLPTPAQPPVLFSLALPDLVSRLPAQPWHHLLVPKVQVRGPQLPVSPVIHITGCRHRLLTCLHPPTSLCAMMTGTRCVSSPFWP